MSDFDLVRPQYLGRECFETFGLNGGYICSAADHYFTAWCAADRLQPTDPARQRRLSAGYFAR